MEAIDLKIIQQLYFKAETDFLIFDPQQRLKGACPNQFEMVKSNNQLTEVLEGNAHKSYILFNLSTNKNTIDFNDIRINNVVHFNQNNTSKSGIKHYFVNNTNGTIRWIFPSTNQSAIFLSLYNNAGWKAKTYKALVKMCTLVGIEKIFSQGYFTFEKMTSSIYDFLPNQYHDDYAIFTGTAGENRKAIVAIAAHKYVRSFVKIPLTKKAKALVRNEKQQLDYIRELKLVKMGTPKCTGTSDHLELSNIKPIDSIQQSELTNQHFEGIAEMYSKTIQQVNPQATTAWNEIQSNLRWLNDGFEIKNNIEESKISSIIHQLNQLVDGIGDHDRIAVGLAHGDFTPWNMYLTKEKIHVYDWEMSSVDMPLLYDVFHYVFQNNILIKQNKYESIQNELDQINQNPIVKDLVANCSIDWSLHYAFYLAYVTSYYLPLYISQQDLHMQAHWLIDVWADALEALSFSVEEVEV